MELADTSAWTGRVRDGQIRREFDQAVLSGDIATCDMVKLELLVSARDAGELSATRAELDQLPAAPMGERVWRRALEVLELLAERGPLHHRQVPLADLLIAAAAERAGLTLLHYDRHFEIVASVTGQRVRALAPLGSL